MKRFIISILCVAVFFLGLGGIFESASAKFKSDEKALELIKLSRIAIGGDANLRAVNSMTIMGTTTHYFEKAGIQDVKQGSLELNMQFPNQMSKFVKIGNPGEGGDAIKEVHKEVVVVGGDGDGNITKEIIGDGSGENVFVIKKGDGDVDWTSKGDNVEFGDGKIIIKKDDGTVEEIKTDGKQKIRIRKDANGNVLTEDIEGGDGQNVFVIKKGDGDVNWTSDGSGNKRVIVEKDDMHFGGKMRNNEMLRMTIGLLMTAPEGMNANYKFLGTGNVDGFASNIIEVNSHGSSFKLFLDSSSNLPRAVSYTGGHRVKFVHKDGTNDMTKAEVIAMKESMKDAPKMERMIKFSDFRSVGGVMLPYHWVETVDGKQSQITDITSIEINPANIADKFNNKNVFVRKMKGEN